MSLKLIRRPGRPHWYMHGTVRGVPVRESTKTDNREAAEAIRAKREWELLQRSVHGAQATATFLEAAVSYLEADGETRFIQPLLDRIGSVPLAKIDQALVDDLARNLYPNCANSSLTRKVYTPISAIMHHAAKRKLCAAPTLERPKQPEGRTRWLTFEEAERLIEACAPHLRPLVVFLFGTGARLSEALYLDWRNVDLRNGQVNFIKTKNGEARGVPLHPRLIAELIKLPQREGAVFRTHLGVPYAVPKDGGGQIETAFKAACRRAGIEDFSPHCCRHTWASWHYQANRDLISLMRLGGWRSERNVLRYAHVNVTQLAPSIEAGLSGWEHNRTKSAPDLKLIAKRK